MLAPRIQQPIKAKQEGKGGRKHTLAPISIDPLTGEIKIRLLCSRPECACEGLYTVEELLLAVEEFKKLAVAVATLGQSQEAA